MGYWRNRARVKNIQEIEGEKSEIDDNVAEIKRALLNGDFDNELPIVKNLDKVCVDSNGSAKAVNKVSFDMKKRTVWSSWTK